ncbi:hypothetical protein MTQ01_23335 [Streptomyces sp. XM4193]|uniref:hypothetical protein n=1 Tax=Streptomyces sp. XM4193 TaxID=2929782 RepID=UPI001FF7D99A|nr:hypothetical protein [Streptomyces sp. XM4193]MCK1798905.1 hypothetical protein [Streptomyces sp. XM4193]
MSDRLHVNIEELGQLGSSLAHHAYDLGSYVSDFRRSTDLEPVREVLERLDSVSYEQLAEAVELAGSVVGKLQDRLDEASSGVKEVVRNTSSVQDDFADDIRDLL